MAKVMGGTKLSIGPVRSRPTKPMPCPSCTISVSMPKPTSAESRVVSAALTAITIDRKAIVSTRNVTPITYSRNHGALLRILLPMSVKAAFWPDT